MLNLVVHIVTTGLQRVHFLVAQSLGYLCNSCGTAGFPVWALLCSEQPIKYDVRRGYFLKSSFEKQGEGRGCEGVCKIVHKFKNDLYSYVLNVGCFEGGPSHISVKPAVQLL